MTSNASTPSRLASAVCAALVCGIALEVSACSDWDTETQARERAVAVLGCHEVVVASRSHERFRIEGCGRSVDVLCTSGRNDPTCIAGRPSDATLSDVGAGGEVPPPPEAPPTSGREAVVRAGLDARRGDVLACASRPSVVVRATYASDGSVVFGLNGELAGSPEEGCVRAALDGVRVEPGEAGVVLHLVR